MISYKEKHKKHDFEGNIFMGSEPLKTTKKGRFYVFSLCVSMNDDYSQGGYVSSNNPHMFMKLKHS